MKVRLKDYASPADEPPAMPACPATPMPNDPAGHEPRRTARPPRLASGLVLASLAAPLAPPQTADALAPALSAAQPSIVAASAPPSAPASAPSVLPSAPSVPPSAASVIPSAASVIPSASEESTSHRQPTYTNPIARGADPWVLRHEDHYYFCQAAGDNAITVWKSDRLTTRGRARLVWTAPRRGWNCGMVWAPELHRIRGRWFIYYAAAAGPWDNAGHRVGVLEGLSDDPQGPYADRGLVYTGDDPDGRAHNRWAIDATVLDHAGRLYLIWSGWPGDADVQYLYIAPLETPWATAGPRVRLCDNDTYVWERVGEDPRERGLHEAPQVLQHAGRTFLIYSCSASWLPTYKLGLLELVGDDPLDPRSWRKHPEPVFASTPEVFGVGHASFTVSPDGGEHWMAYHAKRLRKPGWDRVVCVQRFDWTPEGLPNFGPPVPWHTPLPAPE